VQMDVDAIVHPTNSSLSFGGEIGQFLQTFLLYTCFSDTRDAALGSIVLLSFKSWLVDQERMQPVV